jgi:hypothetical protein
LKAEVSKVWSMRSEFREVFKGSIKLGGDVQAFDGDLGDEFLDAAKCVQVKVHWQSMGW